MADVTGRAYEAFVEYLLRRINYRDEWTSGSGRQYLYEKHPEGTCHKVEGACKHSKECDQFSKSNHIPYGPWYDPDFFVLEGDLPLAAIHVTHWSNPRSSQYKFWRTIEEHFEYKINFSREFLSINLVFQALDAGEQPRRVVDSKNIIELNGWSPANGSMLAVSFDSSILFPLEYWPIESFVALLPKKIPGAARPRRQLFNSVWDGLYGSDVAVKKAVDQVVKLIKVALSARPNPRYSKESIERLQDVCWHGRQRAVDLHPTETRYRKGLQHAFILRELIDLSFGSRVNSDNASWSILTGNPRFERRTFRRMLSAGSTIKDEEIDALIDKLSRIPIQMDKRLPIFLLNGKSGLDHAEWNSDLKQFILGLKLLNPANLVQFRKAIQDLFTDYRLTSGMSWVLADLHDSERIKKKVAYLNDNFIGITTKAAFVAKVASDMLSPGKSAAHQLIVNDMHNWPADLILEFYDLGSMQHITTALPAKFQKSYGHSLRPYGYMNDPGRLISHLISGSPVGQYFSNGTQLDEEAFYKAIWPLFAECLWEAIGKRKPLDAATVEMNYRYKKSMRIISSPDLEPISFLLRRSIPSLSDGPTLRGAFNQLSTSRGWSRAALTTETTSKDEASGAIIQTQAVIGAKNIDHKSLLHNLPFGPDWSDFQHLRTT
jgi:hypothetical protein